jgi:thiosulfate/3-mercaptopyruvate sulfurtransferase
MSPLITVDELAQALETAPPTLLDVRWTLAGPERDAYLQGHIPGARFVDLDRELAAPPGPGRHPLPEPDAFAAAMRAHGVSGSRTVVVYDGGPATSAARAWWLLRYHGHPRVLVLDGGLSAWTAAGRRLASGEEPAGPEGGFVSSPGHMPLLDAAGAAEVASSGVLVDARAPERFSGAIEPVDPVAGHIPGARNLATAGNIGADGRFLAPDALRARFEEAGIVAGGATPGAYCGSGVTAAHEVLAAEIAGFRMALYAGSWSEWITDDARPVAHGAG